jgi:hypothetical protein
VILNCSFLLENPTLIQSPNQEWRVEMKISEIKEDQKIAIAWGVEIDEEVFDPPASIRTIGLLWEGADKASISDSLIDTVIAFTLSGAEVIVEVRPTDDIDHNYLLTLAGNAGFSISAIPPQCEEELDLWVKQCAGFARAVLTTPNFAGHLYPVTGYLTYLIMEFFGGAEAMTPSDPYTRQRFFEVVPESWSDTAKEQMRQEMSDILGGEDHLKEYLGAILKAVQEEAKKQFLEQMRARSSS